MQKITKNFLSGLIYLSLLLSISSAFAGDGKVLITAEGVKYITGGIGEEETAVMHRIAKDFSLNLVFSESTGGRITGINAVIYNEQGKRVFYIKSADPLLYVNLPSGKYRVLANYEGNKQGYVFELDAITNKKIILNWKNSGETEPTANE